MIIQCWELKDIQELLFKLFKDFKLVFKLMDQVLILMDFLANFRI